MLLGTPVVTSPAPSLPQIAGDVVDAANPYEIDEIAQAIQDHEHAQLRARSGAPLLCELDAHGPFFALSRVPSSHVSDHVCFLRRSAGLNALRPD